MLVTAGGAELERWLFEVDLETSLVIFRIWDVNRLLESGMFRDLKPVELVLQDWHVMFVPLVMKIRCIDNCICIFNYIF